MGQKSEKKKKLFFNSVFNFRRVTHFRLCLLETQVLREETRINTKVCIAAVK